MRYSIRKTLFIALLLATLSACGKKGPSSPAAENPNDGVSSVPPVAERATDLSAVDLPIAGAVKEVKAKVLDKEADDKTKGLVRIKAFEINGPVDISENTRWEVWKPGADPEEQKPEITSWASNEQAVTPGTWDIRLHYEDGPICKADGWIRNVVVDAGKLWKAEAVMAAPMQYVRVFATLDGKDAADSARIEVFKAGTDEEEFHPLATFWSTQKQAMAAGNYDFRISYDKDKVKAKAAVKGFAVNGDHGVQKKTIALVK
jgi:predicted small lipoprotein YifL